MSDRIGYRRAFVEGERRLEVAFYTTSLEKFLQARAVFEGCGLVLRHFRSRTEPYAEDYTRGKRALLLAAIKEVAAVVGRTSVFFVEDTSLRIEALSTASEDVPGLAVKEWFPATTFDSLDAKLRQLNAGRKAVVMSDIALHVPGLATPLLFSGVTSGRVADDAPSFPENPICPWLTPSTFNGWFIPDGADRCLGAMSFEESCKYDFRVQSLVRMLDRLEEYAAALNLPTHAYSRRAAIKPTFQSLLFEIDPLVLVVIGPSCAGKTTFREWGSAKRDAKGVEASHLMRMLGEDLRQPGMSDAELAQAVVAAQGPDTIARAALREIQETTASSIILTGFRLIEEVEFIKKEIPKAKVVLIDASVRTRYERHLKRGRGAPVRDLRAFRAKDLEQEQFGLLRVGRDIADVVVENEGSLDEYLQQVALVLAGQSGSGISRDVRPRAAPRNRVYRCLRILSEAGRPMTCDEIEAATRKDGAKPIPQNNVNKVLKAVSGLVHRYEPPGDRLQYDIADHGRAYLRAMDRRGVSNATR